MLIERLSAGLDVTQVGSKTAGLCRAMELSLTVPRGLVVTRETLQSFLTATGLEPRVRALLTSEASHQTRAELFSEFRKHARHQSSEHECR